MALISIKEAAQRLEVAETTVRRRIRNGEVRARQVARPQGFVWMVELPDEVPSVVEPVQELTTQIGFRHMEGFLNRRSFEMTAVAENERLPLNKPVLWTFEYEGGMGMRMPHPMHIHGVRFRILQREIYANETPEVTEGFVDSGYKDTLLIFPGQRIQVLLSATQPGLFMYHCHNLEHEDGGMMRNFLAEARI